MKQPTIKKSLLTKIEHFCKLNEINTEVYINRILQLAFTEDVYGAKPTSKPKITKPTSEAVNEGVNEDVNEDVNEGVNEGVKEESVTNKTKEKDEKRDIYGE